MNCESTYNGKRRATQSPPRSAFLRHCIFLLSLGVFLMPALFSAGCRKKAEKRYPAQGTVIAAHADQGILEIDEDEIPGYMAAMKMSYVVANPAELRGLRPGDLVKAELVLSNGSAKLEKIALIRKAGSDGASGAAPSKKE